MKRNYLAFMVLLGVFFTMPAQAVSFNDMDRWDPAIKYLRGDVVTVDYDIYVSVLPSENISPLVNKFRWRRVDYKKYRNFAPRKLYRPGKVVVHDGLYYLARKFNVPRSDKNLQDSSRWLEFTHPGIVYDLPEPDDSGVGSDTIVGIDSNNNGVRDDYELEVIFSDLEPATVDAALAAGKAYGKLVESGLDSVSVDQAGAQNILNQLIYAEQCKRAIQRAGGKSWSETSYYNTFDRVEAKFKLQNVLEDLIDTSAIDTNNPDPCSQLQIN